MITYQEVGNLIGLDMENVGINLYVIEDYENETTFRPQKNKPNIETARRGRAEVARICQNGTKN